MCDQPAVRLTGMCSFASFFWPRQGVNYSKLMDIHSKLASETTPAPKKAKAKRKVDGEGGASKKKAKVEPLD